MPTQLLTFRAFGVTWNVLNLFWLIIGTLLEAVAVVLFLAPTQIAPGGITGLAILLHEVLHLPIGVMVFIFNIPIQLLGYRTLGGRRVIILTIVYVVLYSVMVDVLTPILDVNLSDDHLLNAIFGGILGGVGVGMIHAAGGTAGGTATIARILQVRYGFPMSSAFLYTDSVIILLAAVLLGGEAAMLAITALFLGGIASDYILEGPSVIRTLVVVTDYPAEISHRLIYELQRGVTSWEGMGRYTEEPRHVLFVAVGRSQVNYAQHLIHEVDPEAFIVVGQGHVAYGEGFKKRTSTIHQIF